jgi:hypothetical protein
MARKRGKRAKMGEKEERQRGIIEEGEKGGRNFNYFYV